LAALTIIALLVGVAGAVARPFRLPGWAVPIVAAAVVLLAGGLSLDAARAALDPLNEPIGFLLAAVPLAVLLDRFGYFSALATLLTRGERGVGGLWVLAALVTTVLNLDAAVVLLTPLYVNVARRTGRDPLTLALIPVLLACLASSALPVSNLTNLIAQAATGASTGGFLANLALPSLVATTVGWVLYRRRLAVKHPVAAPVTRAATSAPPADAPEADPDRSTRILVVGSVIVAAVLIGFTGGRLVGIAPWVVALAADVVLIALCRELPVREIPVGTALVAISLGVLAAAAVAHLPVHQLLAGTSTLSQAKVTGLMAAAANVANNLPALLVAIPTLGHQVTPTLWSVLLGVNMGPVLLATGSLASLLWLDALGRLGVEVRARDFSLAGLRIGLPAAAAGAGVHLLLHVAGVR
jgi:arsenical pump membrane protein